MLLAANVFARKLLANVAYHSPFMAPIATKYRGAIRDMKALATPLSSMVAIESRICWHLSIFCEIHTYEKLSSESSQKVGHQDLYQALDSRGYEFGSAFRSLNNILSSEGGSRADVEVFDGLYNEQLQPHIVHPTTLDGTFQLGLASSFCNGSLSGPLAVPTSIKVLWISKKCLSSTDSGIIKAASVSGNNLKMLSDPATTIEYLASAVDESEAKLLVKIDGLRMSAIENSPEIDAGQADNSMCHSLSLFPDVSLLSNNTIIALCSHLTNTLRLKLAEDVTFKKLLEDDIASEQFIRRVEAASGHGKLFVKVGRSLREILSGGTDPLGLLFGHSDDVVRQTYTFYNDDTSHHWRKLSMYIKLMTQRNPNMNILEIGAGTGATTEILMKTFIPDMKNPHLSRYDYTDI
ncbi:hypothetical protein EAF04_005153 [Stromatinia cepivora]|nr:hypothetical protein EAF04_005153 [Stromatinia cepivora]